MRFRLHKTGIIIGTGALVAAALGAGPAGAVPAAPRGAVQTAAAGAFPDFDGDGAADLVYGVGSTQSQVVVKYGSGTSTVFDRVDAGGVATSPDNAMGFGQGLLARDLNGDGITDLVVVDESQGGAGSGIFVILGAAGGLQVAGAHRYGIPSGMYGFAGTPALVESPTKLLVVSASVPSSVSKGGAVLAYQLGADGLPAGQPTTLSQRNLPGSDETGDGFGGSIAASGSMLLIGAPGEDVGKAKDAGSVTVLRYRGGTKFTGSTVTQSTKGVSGKVEKGDRFGSAVAISDGWAVVGVPGEDGAKRDSGVIATFTVGSSSLKPKATISQSTKGVPGASEAGDRFGTSVAVIRVCPDVPGVLVGAPAEAMGVAGQAGSAWVIPFTKACPARQLAEGGNLGGAATAMANVGSAVSALRTNGTAADVVVITAPGTTEEGVYGRVLTLAYPYAGVATTAASELRLNEEGTIAVSPPAS